MFGSSQYDEDAKAAAAGGGHHRLARLRQPDRAGRPAPGEVVLDLGSGGGIDVLLSARRVGPDGQGLRPGHDRRDAGARTRPTRPRPGSPTSSSSKGHIEDIPLPDNSVDVIISNCVINLSGDKDQVFAEAFRVLRARRSPGRLRRRAEPAAARRTQRHHIAVDRLHLRCPDRAASARTG